MPRYKGHLICSKAGNVRFTKGASAKSNEVAVAFDFELPAALFEKPVIKMKASVDAVHPIVVTPELRIKAQEILEETFKVPVELAVPEGLDGLPLAHYVRMRYPDVCNAPKCVDCGTECPTGEICDELADELHLPHPCRACQGEGAMLYDDKPSETCTRCRGTGIEPKEASHE